jgi:two-component system sensor histidine kinase RegB
VRNHAIAQWGFSVRLQWWALALALGIAGSSNIAIVRLHQRKRWPSANLMGGVLVLDTALLTLLLAASGGSMNSFTMFYLVYVTLSAIVLSTRWTISIGGLSLVGFGLLFLVSHATSMHIHGGTVSFSRHLQSMWAAYALAAALVTFFIGKITRAIAVQRDQIATLREANARNARLVGLTTLAIPADVLARVGEPFFTTKQPGRGMGLGVFLARAFVESRGGALVIESDPGRGTRAEVRLPAGAAA